MLDINLTSSTLIADLWRFKAPDLIPPGASSESVVMFTGRHDVHGSLKALLTAAASSLIMNMYGMDDAELWDIIWSKVEDPRVLVQITLDKSQAGGPTEKRILDASRGKDLAGFRSHIAIGQSATHQISHTKAGVIDGIVGWHGSVNWSASGEGTFVGAAGPGGVGYKAQNNTLEWFTAREKINGFRDELQAEHAVAMAQMAKAGL